MIAAGRSAGGVAVVAGACFFAVDRATGRRGSALAGVSGFGAGDTEVSGVEAASADGVAMECSIDSMACEDR
jgi:hypothetical protein